MKIIPITIPFPAAFGLGKPANCYVIKDDQTLLIDTGWDSPENRVALKKALESIDAWPPETILLTHGHIDHFGLGGYLQQLTGAEIMVHKEDAHMLDDYEEDLVRWYDKVMTDAIEGGFETDGLEDVRAKLLLASKAMLKPVSFTAFEDLKIELKGGTLKSMGVPGHTPGSVAYTIREEAFSGDAAIENTVNVEDLKQEFLSLQKLKVFKNIYPGHDRMPLSRQDIEALEAHFVDRLDDVLGACRDGATLRQIVERMYFAMAQEQNVIKMIFPIKQTLAYLHYLEGEGAAGKKEGRWFAFRERL
jgi:glyoxylase-like metal-dependent hydrolase (beta-lactamase superfamily II)